MANLDGILILFRSQSALTLIEDGHTIASRGGIDFSGRWVWEWKKRIDALYSPLQSAF
ncbi:hypothetical protein [Vreelandella zhaodongensis]|uniref:hypothetical protein n=1 Tax=Vreelandella zhaodongensis TaxID=1176240 RepID=UPI003EB88C16